MTKARSLSDFIESDGSVTLVDNQHIKFGTSNDASIRHDGNNTKFTHTGSGGLYLGADSFALQNGTHDENFILMADNGAVTLYYDNSAKLATTSSGVNITGTVDADDLYITGGTTIDGNFAYFKSASTSNASLTLRKDSLGADSIDYLQLRSDGNTLIGKITGAGVVHSTGLVSSGSVSGTSATFTDDVAINNGSPELYFGTTGAHYNWRIAAQENVDAALTIDVGSQDTDYSNDSYNSVFTVKNTGSVGINTQSPTAKLDVRGSVNSEHAVFTGGTNSNRGLSIQTAASGGQQDAGVIFDAQDTEGGANPYIQLKSAGQTVATFSKGSTDKYPSSGGLGGIGGNGANLQLDADDSEIRMANNIIHSDNSGNTKFSIRAAYGALSSDAELSLDGGHITFNAGTSFTQVGRFDTDGLKFGSDTAAANALDDYEEGTWTPQLRNGGTALAQNWQYLSGTYTKVGRAVHVHFGGRLSSLSGTSTGELRIYGLPFASATTGGYQEPAGQLFLGNQPTAEDSYTVYAFIHSGQAHLGTRELTGGDDVFESNKVDANTFFKFQMTYYV